MISFILTVLNRPENLSRFFSIMPFQSEKCEWIIVDNKSESATKQIEYWLSGHMPNVVLIENDRNEGFGPGNNQGAEYASGNILVFTQPDVEFRGDVTKYLTGLLDDSLYGHQLLSHNTGWNKFGSVVVPYLTGYFLTCTRTVWTYLGGFDPIYYPADFEDVDLSYTAAQKGLGLKSLDVPIVHAHFGSTWSQFANREEVTKRNRSAFARKWGLQEDGLPAVSVTRG